MFKMKLISYVIFISMILVFSGCVENQNDDSIVDNDMSNGNGAGPIVTGNSVVVEITENGFSPETVTISKGDVVVFMNKDSAPHWPASAVHPTHDEYPQKGGCGGSAFDACREIGPGESYTFVFHYEGTWTYHDHLNPSIYGYVIVE